MPTYDHGVAGLTGTIGVTVLNADGTAHDARTTTGITEPVAGSGVYFFPHPHPGTLLLFVFDGGVGTVGGSVYDDGLTTMPARAGDAMTLATDALSAAALKADAVTEIQAGLATAAAVAAVQAKADSLTTATGIYPIELTLVKDVGGDGADVPAVPLAGVRCIPYSDEARTTPVGEARYTDTLGKVRWDGYAAGTYWIKPDGPGYTYPAVEVTIPE